MTTDVLGRLLRDPGGIARCCREDRDMRAIAVTSIGAIVLGAAAFGGVLGGFRGGTQIVYAAVKVPLAVLATLIVCTPAFHALAASFGRSWPMRSVASLTLAAAGRCCLLLLAAAPVLWLLIDLGIGYHNAALLAALVYGGAGIGALSVIVRGLGEGPHRVVTTISFVLVFFVVAGQTSWVLRPYLVRPRTESVPFLRAREGGFIDSVVRSGRSMTGDYDRPSAPLPDVDMRGER